ncbi:MAG: hypothetical protein JO061_15900 [Acidobacteriaceae bacterium]|nr:hypothetical protein [Acidobacteriaceae bacterium]
MQTLSEFGLEEAPLYVRWTPEGSPIAIELRLDVMPRLRAEIEAAEKLGIEVGGLLIGSPPNAVAPAIRIDDYAMISRGPDDGPVFMVNPREHDRFLTTRWEARTKGRTGVGFFRTHIRPGPLRPSLADRTLLAAQFKDDSYILLLIEGREPRRSALFLGARAKLADEPSVSEFHWTEAEFSALPESVPAMPAATKQPPGGRAVTWAAIVLVFLLAAAGFLLFRAGFPLSFGASHNIELSAAGGNILTITWNHSAPDVEKATAGRLVISDGRTQREIAIGEDELRLGTIEYQRATDEVKVTLELEMPSATSVTQSVTWHA